MVPNPGLATLGKYSLKFGHMFLKFKILEIRIKVDAVVHSQLLQSCFLVFHYLEEINKNLVVEKFDIFCLRRNIKILILALSVRKPTVFNRFLEIFA